MCPYVVRLCAHSWCDYMPTRSPTICPIILRRSLMWGSTICFPKLQGRVRQSRTGCVCINANREHPEGRIAGVGGGSTGGSADRILTRRKRVEFPLAKPCRTMDGHPTCELFLTFLVLFIIFFVSLHRQKCILFNEKVSISYHYSHFAHRRRTRPGYCQPPYGCPMGGFARQRVVNGRGCLASQ